MTCIFTLASAHNSSLLLWLLIQVAPLLLICCLSSESPLPNVAPCVHPCPTQPSMADEGYRLVTEILLYKNKNKKFLLWLYLKEVCELEPASVPLAVPLLPRLALPYHDSPRPHNLEITIGRVIKTGLYFKVFFISCSFHLIVTNFFYYLFLINFSLTWRYMYSICFSSPYILRT